jgi:hypothetical protein
VKVSTWQRPGSHEAEETHWNSESTVRCLLTNPITDREATLRAVGIERRAILEMDKSGSRASRQLAKAAPICGRTLADSRSRFRRGNDDSTQRRDTSKLVKPS